MLGFGKKKKKTEEENKTTAAQTPPPPEKKSKGKKPSKEGDVEETSLPKKKKPVAKKKIFTLLLLLVVIGVSSFLVYTQFFKEKEPGIPIYTKVELNHVNLPEEMLQFSFEHFPNLYASFITFNREVTLIDKELAWIESVAQKYPEQVKITTAEKKVWENGKNTLVKDFSKLEKPVKEAYVLFQVNEAQGLVQVEEKEKELSETAQNSLKTAQDLTKKLKSRGPAPPDNFFQGIMYKLKKKFL